MSVLQSYKGPKILKLGHVTSATPSYGSIYGPYLRVSVLYVCTKFEADIFVPKLQYRSQNLKSGLVTSATPVLRGHFMLSAQAGSVLSVCTKFEANYVCNIW